MLREQAPDLGYEVVLAQGAEAQTLAALPDFDRLWHEASLAPGTATRWRSGTTTGRR